MMRGDDHIKDSELLLKLKAGNNEAFDVIYDRYWERIYFSAFKRLQNKDQAKDITQDVFLNLWMKREENIIENLPAYLYTATRNKVFNWMEREQKYIPVSEVFLTLKASMDQSDAEVLRKDFMKIYENLIETLTPSQQKIFRLRFNKDLSTIQIAQLLDISRKTVQNQLGKAIAQLRASFMISVFFILFLHL